MTLQAHQLACARGDRQLFNGLNFEIKAGEALWVSGSNGAGKTSLLRLLCGLAQPEEGSVRWAGRNIRSLREDFHRDLLYVGHTAGIKDDLTAWENLALGSRLSGKPCSQADALVALDQVGLLNETSLPARSLSQGQRKRVALARLGLRPAPKLMVLDEPFNALDQESIRRLSATLNGHLASGGMLVYTTHQPQSLSPSRLHQLDLNQVSPSC
ncbi:cytochrome c biogenesis heme-transporting ATPase CcmA [Aquabacterium sp. CECT 9606]|uniref:cytochrome c biogenesis heme-transporting ATPase CcmA n=1 Tax=Aquabacterium sp. CECT 9606 TaxID=2845822 RepID=UPI001E4B7C8E|nr:cytochrome c biogenesis heme-transporting ATPase CcmA [Aquabacterium sp. CECT 9606]CAH0352960.1 Cytochrome c biogenesis ATP-binding export protein CcmA [Aquabacterium sp. CECT 9606]